MPFENYLELVEKCEEIGMEKGQLFYRWCGENKSNNEKSSNIELLLLGSLRYLGRIWTFDDIEECTFKSC